MLPETSKFIPCQHYVSKSRGNGRTAGDSPDPPITRAAPPFSPYEPSPFLCRPRSRGGAG